MTQLPAPIAVDQATAPATAIDKILDEYQLAKQTLRWMVEHRAHWDHRTQTLVQSVGMKSTPLLAAPPVAVLAFIHGIAREVELEAEHAD